MKPQPWEVVGAFLLLVMDGGYVWLTKGVALDRWIVLGLAGGAAGLLSHRWAMDLTRGVRAGIKARLSGTFKKPEE